MAPLVVFHNWHQYFADRDTLLFCDNLGAVHSLAGGCTHARDLQVLVSTTHSLLASIRCRWWIEWVQSAANCSDGLSRDGVSDVWTTQQGTLD